MDVQAARKAGYSDAEIANELAKRTGFKLKEARNAGYEDAELIDEMLKRTQSAVPKQPKGFLGRVGERLSERGAEIKKTYTEPQKRTSTIGRVLEPENAIMAAGQIAGGVGDAGAEAISSLTPEFVSYGLGKTAQTIGRGLMALGEATNIHPLDAARAYAEENPRDVRMLGSLANIATVGIGGAGAKAGVKALAEKGAGQLAKEAVVMAKQVPTKVKLGAEAAFSSPQKVITETKNQIGKVVSDATEKAFGKPSKVKTLPQYKGRVARRADAVADLVANKDSLSVTDQFGHTVPAVLPESVEDAVKMTRQRLDQVFDQYESIANKAGQTGMVISDSQKIASELNKFSTLEGVPENVAKYAKKRAEDILKTGDMSPRGTQRSLEFLGNDEKKFLGSSNSRAGVERLIINIRREALNNAMAELPENYSNLKKLYGAHKEFLQDAEQAYFKQLGQKPEDLVSIYTGTQLAAALVSPSHAFHIAKGVTASALEKAYKWQTNPNRLIRNMYKKSDALMQREARFVERYPELVEKRQNGK